MIFILLGYRINDYSHLVKDRNIMLHRKPVYLIIDSNKDRIMYSTFAFQIIGYLFIISGILFYLIEYPYLPGTMSDLIEELKIIFIFVTSFVVILAVVIMLFFEYKAKK
jgi:hypothetical protein